MADLIVSPSVSLAIEKLGELLVQEAFFLSDVRDEVKGLQSELEWMRCFLKDAEARQQKDERICNWVQEIRDVAYEVEDVIDTYVQRSFTQNCFGMVNKGKDLYKLRKHIKKIQKKIGETYGIKDIGKTSAVMSSLIDKQNLLRWTYSHDVEDDVIGLEEDIEKLVSLYDY